MPTRVLMMDRLCAVDGRYHWSICRLRLGRTLLGISARSYARRSASPPLRSGPVGHTPIQSPRIWSQHFENL